MNYILIFKNNNSLQEIGIDISKLKSPVSLNSNTLVYLFNDTIYRQQVKDKFSEKLKCEENIFYIVLHKSQQESSQSWFKEFFKTDYVILESHTEEKGFYVTILPKLIDETCTLEDIKKFFPDIKMLLLRKLFVGDFQLNSEEQGLLKGQKFNIDIYKESYQNTPNFDALDKLKTQLMGE